MWLRIPTQRHFLEDVFAKVRTLLSIWLGKSQLFILQPDNVYMLYYTKYELRTRIFKLHVGEYDLYLRGGERSTISPLILPPPPDLPREKVGGLHECYPWIWPLRYVPACRRAKTLTHQLVDGHSTKKVEVWKFFIPEKHFIFYA